MSDKTRTTRLRKFLQRKDKFGHPIGMKWLGGANTATTTLGGIMSYIIFTIQVVYLCINLDALVSRKGAKIGFDKELTEFDEIGSIKLLLFHIFKQIKELIGTILINSTTSSLRIGNGIQLQRDLMRTKLPKPFIPLNPVKPVIFRESTMICAIEFFKVTLEKMFKNFA